MNSYKILGLVNIAAEHSEIWQFASQLEGHLTEVEDWDLGAGIYIEFLTLKTSFLDMSNPVDGLVCVFLSQIHRRLFMCFSSAVLNLLCISNLAMLVMARRKLWKKEPQLLGHSLSG